MPRTRTRRSEAGAEEDTSAPLRHSLLDTATLSASDRLGGSSSILTAAPTATTESSGGGPEAISPSQNKRLQGKVSSCVECRRLKLKCTRSNNTNRWPCNQCVRRKCGDICPGGTSTPTTKAGNEALLRHYRKRIADLEAKLNSVTGGGVADPPEVTAVTDNSASSNDGIGQRASAAPRIERALPPTHVPAHPPSSSHSATELLQQDDAEPVGFSGMNDPQTHSSRPTAPLSGHASQQNSYHRATWRVDESSRLRETASYAPDRSATTFSSTGPAFYGKNAGALYGQPDTEDVSLSLAVVRPSKLSLTQSLAF